jgi:hypothetical protein
MRTQMPDDKLQALCHGIIQLNRISLKIISPLLHQLLMTRRYSGCRVSDEPALGLCNDAAVTSLPARHIHHD